MKTKINYESDELQNRINLAAAYHLVDLYGFSDIIWTFNYWLNNRRDIYAYVLS